MSRIMLGLVYCLMCGFVSTAEEAQTAEAKETKTTYSFCRVLPLNPEVPTYYMFDYFSFEARNVPEADIGFTHKAEDLSFAKKIQTAAEVNAKAKQEADDWTPPEVYPPLLRNTFELLRDNPEQFVATNGTAVVKGVSIAWTRIPFMVSPGSTTIVYGENPYRLTFVAVMKEHGGNVEEGQNDMHLAFSLNRDVLRETMPYLMNHTFSTGIYFNSKKGALYCGGVVSTSTINTEKDSQK